MPKQVIATCEEKMNKSLDAINRQLANIRTGKANPAILNNVQVSYYGMMTPISQIAQVAVSDSQMIVVKPYDRSIVKDIDKAILTANLGLNPSNDGEVIRIYIPPLTEDVRRQLVKDLKKQGEEGKVIIRNIRRDAIENLKKLEKDSAISEDELKRYTDEVEKKVSKVMEKLESMVSDKEKQIMTV